MMENNDIRAVWNQFVARCKTDDVLDPKDITSSLQIAKIITRDEAETINNKASCADRLLALSEVIKAKNEQLTLLQEVTTVLKTNGKTMAAEILSKMSPMRSFLTGTILQF